MNQDAKHISLYKDTEIVVNAQSTSFSVAEQVVPLQICFQQSNTENPVL